MAIIEPIPRDIQIFQLKNYDFDRHVPVLNKIMIMTVWQLVLSPRKNSADTFGHNTLESCKFLSRGQLFSIQS